jgi:hypothetical protein
MYSYYTLLLLLLLLLLLVTIISTCDLYFEKGRERYGRRRSYIKNKVFNILGLRQ